MEELKRQEIFKNQIWPMISEGATRQKSPGIHLVGGSPGSGKSAILVKVCKSNQGVVVINGDDFRGYHPDYVRLLKQDELNAPDIVQEDCNFWIESSIEFVKENRFSAVLETTLRQPKVVESTVIGFKDIGFITNLHLLACKRELSAMSTFLRFEQQKSNGGLGRISLPRAHAASNNNILNTLSSTLKMFDRVDVFKRDLGEVALIQDDVGDGMEAIALFEKESQKELTSQERTYLQEGWSEVLRLAKLRQAEVEYMEMVAEAMRGASLHEFELTRR